MLSDLILHLRSAQTRKRTNTCICAFYVSLVHAPPEVWNQIQKQFSDKVQIITVLIFFWVFEQQKRHSKKMISHCIFKKWFGQGRQFSCQFFYLQMPSTPEYAQVLMVLYPQLNSVTVLLSPPPSTLTNNYLEKTWE